MLDPVSAAAVRRARVALDMLGPTQQPREPCVGGAAVRLRKRRRRHDEREAMRERVADDPNQDLRPLGFPAEPAQRAGVEHVPAGHQLALRGFFGLR